MLRLVRLAATWRLMGNVCSSTPVFQIGPSEVGGGEGEEGLYKRLPDPIVAIIFTHSTASTANLQPSFFSISLLLSFPFFLLSSR